MPRFLLGLGGVLLSVVGATLVLQYTIQLSGLRLTHEQHTDTTGSHPFAGNTALHWAAEMGNADAIKYLCEHGADANAKKRKTGGTPLHTAADSNMTASVRALLSPSCDPRADVEALLMGDTTPLYLASQRGLHRLARVLLEEGKANVDFTMPVGVFRGEVMAASSDAKSFYSPKNTEIGNGATSLHAAVENGGWFV